MRPSVGRVVHYVSYGTPGGEYSRECRAAVITAVYWTTAYSSTPVGLKPAGTAVPDENGRASLAVLNPTGLFFNQAVPFDGGSDEEPATCLCGGRQYPGGTWHWPEIVRAEQLGFMSINEVRAKAGSPPAGLADGEAA